MENQEKLKKCPFCAEMIKEEAKICRFCGKNLKEEESLEKIKKLLEYIKKYKVPMSFSMEYLKFQRIDGNKVYFEVRNSKFSILLFIILCCLWIIPGILYLIYCFFQKGEIKEVNIIIGDNAEVISSQGIPFRYFKKYNKNLKNSSK